MAMTRTGFFRYTMLPGVLPRVSDLLRSGFHFMASLLAVIYYNVGLLPSGHAYLDPKNTGRYGIRHVVAEAGQNLVFSRKHIDQVVVYFTILIGLVLLLLQFCLLFVSLFSHPALASAWSSVFSLSGHSPSQDMAFVVLDNVFGVLSGSGSGGFFGSCIGDLTVDCTDITGQIITTPASFPRPMHLALHQMLQFYSLGIAFLAAGIILYFIVAIVGETLTSGTPFGTRFNRAWFIPRLIVFFALIAPISTGANQGINVAQFITLYAAKFGSNMATNAWLGFVDSSSSAASVLFSQNQSLIARPNVPEIGDLSQFMHVVRMCMYAEKVINGLDVRPYLVREHSTRTDTVYEHNGSSEPYNQMGGTANDYQEYFYTPSLKEAIIFSRYKTVVLRFGHRNPPGGSLNDPNDPPGVYDNEWGNVEPTCGELHFELTSLDPYVIGSDTGLAIQENYYLSIQEYLRDDEIIDITTYCMVQAVLPYDPNDQCVDRSYTSSYDDPAANAFAQTSNTEWLSVDAARANIEGYNAKNKYFLAGETTDWGTYSSGSGTSVFDDIEGDLDNSSYENNLLMPPELRDRGWGGAALWYNKIAHLNGMVSSAVQNLPRPFKYPKVMEQVAAEHQSNDNNMSYTYRFNPRLQNGQLARLPRPGDQYIAAVLYSSFDFWQNSKVQETVFTKATGNSILDVINMIIGTQGLYDILENNEVHPLAMLSAMGKSMVDASLRNLFVGMVGQGIGELLSDNFIGSLAKVASSFSFQFGMIGLSIGFLLYYVLPLMPFIYFFFAFSGWIKSIFEAFVAMPLWAVAHIKIDGQGLPGPWATNGYFLLLEIFIRPILIIFGFLISISLFSALVNVLHQSFYLLTLVATGYDIEAEVFTPLTLPGGQDTMNFWRSPLDEFFYTLVYTMIVYMIGLSCFKLVDQIPNSILRWMGVTVSTFKENAGDPAGELSGKMFRSTQITNAQIMGLMARAKGRGTGTEVDDTIISTGGY